jgi:hypothetical protein
MQAPLHAHTQVAGAHHAVEGPAKEAAQDMQSTPTPLCLLQSKAACSGRLLQWHLRCDLFWAVMGYWDDLMTRSDLLYFTICDQHASSTLVAARMLPVGPC